MVHPGGFEPPTARFVAEYSIQLSYGCIGKLTLLQILILLLKPYQVRDGASGRITRLRLTLQVVAKATLSSLVLNLLLQLHSITAFAVIKERYGASGRIRTSDRSVRSRVLYPAELRMHRKMAVRRGFEPRMQLLTAYSLSRGAPSASRPPHHTPLTSASKNLLKLIVAAMAHILLSGTYKSMAFSITFICLHTSRTIRRQKRQKE